MQYLLDFKSGRLTTFDRDTMINYDTDEVDLHGLIPVLISTTDYSELDPTQEHKGTLLFVDQEDVLYGWHCGARVIIRKIEDECVFCENADDYAVSSWLSIKAVQVEIDS